MATCVTETPGNVVGWITTTGLVGAGVVAPEAVGLVMTVGVVGSWVVSVDEESEGEVGITGVTTPESVVEEEESTELEPVEAGGIPSVDGS